MRLPVFPCVFYLYYILNYFKYILFSDTKSCGKKENQVLLVGFSNGRVEARKKLDGSLLETWSLDSVPLCIGVESESNLCFYLQSQRGMFVLVL